MWLLIGTALAYPEIRLAPGSGTVVEEYRSFMQSQERYKSDLACENFAEGLSMCFRYVHKGKLPYVLESDLKRWDATLMQLTISVTDKSVSYVNKERYTFQQVDDVNGGYWASARKDGWDEAALLHPERLQQLLGSKPLVAVPQAGMFLFWPQGSPQLNRAVTVGVKEIYQQSDQPVSPYVYRWNGDRWVVWGEAVKRKEP